MIQRDGDMVTLKISMKEYSTLTVALGYAMGAAIDITHRELLEDFKRLLRSLTQRSTGPELIGKHE